MSLNLSNHIRMKPPSDVSEVFSAIRNRNKTRAAVVPTPAPASAALRVNAVTPSSGSSSGTITPSWDCDWCNLFYGSYPYSRTLLFPGSEADYTMQTKIVVADVWQAGPSISFALVPMTHAAGSTTAISENIWLQRCYKWLYETLNTHLGSMDHVFVLANDGPDSTQVHYCVLFAFDETVSSEDLGPVADAIMFGNMGSAGWALPAVNTTFTTDPSPVTKTMAVQSDASRAAALKNMFSARSKSKVTACSCTQCNLFTSDSALARCSKAVLMKGPQKNNCSYMVLSSVEDSRMTIEVVPRQHQAVANNVAFVQACEMTKGVISKSLSANQITETTSADSGHECVTFTLTDVTLAQYHNLITSFQRLNL